MMGFGAVFALVRLMYSILTVLNWVMWPILTVLGRVMWWISPVHYPVMWSIFSICYAYVDLFRLGSMDFELDWGDHNESCGVVELISNLKEIVLDPKVVTLQEIHAKCACKMGHCGNVPMDILKDMALPLEMILARMGRKSQELQPAMEEQIQYLQELRRKQTLSL
jgi:hypothetical protein